VLDESWNVSPLESLLKRMDYDRIDDAVRVF
jgi:hypothetical protein